MQIVIDIDDNLYTRLLDKGDACVAFDMRRACVAIRKGTTLPKGHGRLIDERQINECKQVGLIIQDDAVTRCLVTDAPTIIEAERQSLQQIRINRQMRRNDADSN